MSAPAPAGALPFEEIALSGTGFFDFFAKNAKNLLTNRKTGRIMWKNLSRRRADHDEDEVFLLLFLFYHGLPVFVRSKVKGFRKQKTDSPHSYACGAFESADFLFFLAKIKQ